VVGLLLGFRLTALRLRKSAPSAPTADPSDAAVDATCRETEFCIACRPWMRCPCPNHPSGDNVIYACKHGRTVPQCAGVCWSQDVGYVDGNLYACWSCSL
jgi:hypothetical protein